MTPSEAAGGYQTPRIALTRDEFEDEMDVAEGATELQVKCHAKRLENVLGFELEEDDCSGRSGKLWGYMACPDATLNTLTSSSSSEDHQKFKKGKSFQRIPLILLPSNLQALQAGRHGCKVCYSTPNLGPKAPR